MNPKTRLSLFNRELFAIYLIYLAFLSLIIARRPKQPRRTGRQRKKAVPLTSSETAFIV